MWLHAVPVFLLLANALAAPSRPRGIPNAEAELHLPAAREDSSGGGILQSILQTLNPFYSRKSRDLDDYLTSFKKRLVREASDLTHLYVRAASDVYPGRGGRERRQTEQNPERDFRRNHRPKRHHPLEWPLFEDSEGVPMLREVVPSGSLGFFGGSQKIYMTSWHNRSFVAVVGNSRNVSLYTLDSQTLQATHWATVDGNVACDFGVVTNDRLLLTCVEDTTTSSPVVNVYQVLEDTVGGNVSLSHHQVIRAEHPIDVKMWTQLDTTILMVAESLKMVNVTVETDSGTKVVTMANYETVSFVYEWAGEYFDAIQELPGTRPYSVTHIRIYNAHFIAMANFVNNKGHHNIYSTIYKYSLNVGHFVPFQQILTKGAYHFETFVLGSGLGSDTFLAVANHCEDNENGGCNPHTNSHIYRYRLGKFILYQDIPTSYAVAWLAIQVETNVILALASSMTGVTFYQFDGWNFVAKSLKDTKGAIDVGVNSISMVSLPDRILMGVSNHNPDKMSSNLFTLNINYTNSLDSYHHRADEWCQNRRGSIKKLDVTELEARVASAPQAASGHVFTQHVTITADLTVDHTANVTMVHVTEPDVHIPMDWSHLSDLQENVEKMAASVAAKVNDSIFVDSPQTWPADLHFADLKVESESKVDELFVNEVNGVTFPADDDVIRLTGASYSTLHSLSFEHVEAEVDTHVTNLTGRPFSSYVTLHGTHNITGNTTFLGVVKASVVESTSGYVDDLLVRNSTVLTTTGQQEYLGAFTCQSVNVFEIEPGTLNGVDIKQFHRDVVTVDGTHDIYGTLSLEELVYQGNLETNVSANIDLVNPLRTDVTATQEVTAIHKLRNLEVEDLEVGGNVNSVKIPEDVFINGSDYFVYSASLSNVNAASIQIMKKLDHITVNNDDRLNILQTSGDQVVTAPKTFREFHLADTFLTPVLEKKRRSIPDECTLSSSTGITELEGNFEKLRGLLQGLSVTKEFLMLIRDAQPGKMVQVPIRFADLYAEVQKQEAITCALVQSDVVFTEMLTLADKPHTAVTPYVNRTWSADGLAVMILKLEGYVEDMKELFISYATEIMTWPKLVEFFHYARRQMADTVERDLPLLRLIKNLFDSQTSQRLINPVHSFCDSVCPVKGNENVCYLGIMVIRNIVRRIASYPSVLETTSIPSQKQDRAQMISLAIIERDIDALLGYLSADERLQESLHIASLCSFSKKWNMEDDNDQTALEVLLAFEDELENLSADLKRKRRSHEGVLATTADEVGDSWSGVTEGSTEDIIDSSNVRAFGNIVGGEFNASISLVPPEESSEVWSSLSVYFHNLENFVNTIYKLDGPFVNTANDEIRKIIHLNIDYLKALDSNFSIGIENVALLEHLSESLILGRELMMNYRITPDVASSVKMMKTLPWIRRLMNKIVEQTGSKPKESSEKIIDTRMGPILPVTYKYEMIINDVFRNLSQKLMTEDAEEDRKQRILLLMEVAEKLMEAKRSIYLSRQVRDTADEAEFIDALISILKMFVQTARSYTNTYNASEDKMKKYREELLQITRIMNSVYPNVERIADSKLWEIKWLKDQLIEDMAYCKEGRQVMTTNLNCELLLNSGLTHIDIHFPFLPLPTGKEPVFTDSQVTSPLQDMNMLSPNRTYLSAILAFLKVVEAGLPIQNEVAESQMGLPVVMGFVTKELDSVVDILTNLESDIWNIGGAYDTYLTNRVKNFLVACDLLEKYSDHVTDDVLIRMNKIRHLISIVRYRVLQASTNLDKSAGLAFQAPENVAEKSNVINIANSRDSISAEVGMKTFSEVCSNITAAISEGLMKKNSFRTVLDNIQNHLNSMNFLWPIHVKVSSHRRLGYAYLSKQSNIVRKILAKLKNNLVGTITSREENFSPEIFKTFVNILRFVENSDISINSETFKRLDTIYMESSAVLELISESLSCLESKQKSVAETTLALQSEPSTHVTTFSTDQMEHTSSVPRVVSFSEAKFEPPSSYQMPVSLLQVKPTDSEQVKSESTSSPQGKTVTYPNPNNSDLLLSLNGCSEFHTQVESDEHVKVLLTNLKAAKEYLQLLVSIEPFTIEAGKKEVKSVSAFLTRVVPKVYSVLHALDVAPVEKQTFWDANISLVEAKGLVRMLKHVKAFALLLPHGVAKEIRYVLDQAPIILKKIITVSACFEKPQMKPASVSLPSLPIAFPDDTTSLHDATTLMDDSSLPHSSTYRDITYSYDGTSTNPYESSSAYSHDHKYLHVFTTTHSEDDITTHSHTTTNLHKTTAYFLDTSYTNTTAASHETTTTPSHGTTTTTTPSHGTTTTTTPSHGTTTTTTPSHGTTTTTTPSHGTTTTTTPSHGTTTTTTTTASHGTTTTTPSHGTASPVFRTKNSKKLLYHLGKTLKYLQTLNSSLPWNLHPTPSQDSSIPSYLKATSNIILENLELLANQPVDQLENLKNIFHSRAEQFARMMKYAKSSRNLKISQVFMEQLDHMGLLLQVSLKKVTETMAALEGYAEGEPHLGNLPSTKSKYFPIRTTTEKTFLETSNNTVPISSPTSAPTSSPTSAPTSSPTSSPTSAPTSSPTSSPTSAPTSSPTSAPTSSSIHSTTTGTLTPSPTPSLWEELVSHHKEKTRTLATLKQFQAELVLLTTQWTSNYSLNPPSNSIKNRRSVPSEPQEAMAATLNVARSILETLASTPTSRSVPVYEQVINELQEIFQKYEDTSSGITPVTEDDLVRIRALTTQLLPAVDEVILLLENEVAELKHEIDAVEEELLGPILGGDHVGPPLPMSTEDQSSWEIFSLPKTHSLVPSSSMVHGLVSGYKIELLSQSLRQDMSIGDNATEFVVNHRDKIRNVAFKAHLRAGDVNGVNVTRLRESGVALDAARVNVSLSFVQHVGVAGNVTVEQINGVPAEEYVTKDGTFTFDAPVQFMEGVMMKENVTVTSTLNDLDLGNVTSKMSRVTGAKNFQTDLVFGHVDAGSVDSPRVTISDVGFGDTVKKNESAIITGRKIFLGDLHVDSGPVQARDVAAETLDGANVTDLFFGSLRKSPRDLQLVEGGFKIQTLKIEKSLSTEGLTILPRDDSVPYLMNFTSFSRHVVYKDEDCIIHGDLVLFGNTEVHKLGFHDSFDGVPFSRYEAGWLLQEANQTLKGHLTVAPNMNALRVVTLPGVTVQGVDVVSLNTSAMKVDESETFFGPVVFELVSSEGPVTVDGRVQGWDLSAEGIVQTASNPSGERVLVFTGTKTFLGETFYGADFNVTGLVNGVDLESVCPLLNYHHFHSDSAIFLGEVKGEEVHLGKDRDILDAAFADSFWRSDQAVLLPNTFSFDKVAAVHVTTNSTVNQVNLKDFDASVLRNYCAGGSQEVAGSFSFTNLTVSSLQTTFVQTETLDTWPASDLMNIMTQDEKQTITGHMYFDNVLVLGNIDPFATVGGLETSEFCRRGSPCSVEAPKGFSNLTVVGNHTVQDMSTVQGVDVSEALKGAVTNATCGLIPGRTTFAEGLQLTYLWTSGLVDGVNMTSHEVLTLSENQVMQGSLSILGGSEDIALTVESLTSDDGHFNSMNLTDLWNTAVRLDRENVVSGQVHFQGEVTFQDLSLHKTLEGVLDLIASPPDVSELALPYEYTYNISRINHHVLEGQAKEFWGWRRVQEFHEPLVRLAPLVMDPLLQGRPSSNTTEYLALITSLGSTKVFKLLEDGRYEDTNINLGGVCTKNAVGYTSHGEEFVVTGHVCLDVTSDDSTKVAGDKEVLIWNITAGGARLTSSVSTPGAADVQMVMLRERPCLVIVHARGNEILVTCENSPGHFQELQRMTTTFNPVKVTVVEHMDPSGSTTTFLGVADEGDSHEYMGSFMLWRYDVEEDSFSLLQVISMDDVKWVEMTSHLSDLFLVVVSGAFRGDQQGQVLIYRMDWFDGDGTQALGHYGTAVHSGESDRLTALRANPQFYFVQEAAVEDPVEARFYTLPDGELDLYIIKQDGMVVRFSQKGIHRFWKDGELHAPGKVTLDVWSSWVNGRIVQRLNAGGSSCQDIEKKNFPEEPAVVLEALRRGGVDSQGQPPCPANH